MTEIPLEWGLNEAETLALNEAINDRLLSLRKVKQWISITSEFTESEDGPSLELLKEISGTLREMAASSPWPKRGAQLIHSYVFGRGVNYSGTDKPRFKKIMEDPHNQSVMFSVSAYETANLARFTDGNYFALKTDEGGYTKYTVVPISQITGVSTDPDDASSIWYLKRSWSANGTFKEMWYPLARYKGRVGAAKLRKTIRDVPVAKNAVIYHHPNKKQAGWTWGVPESLAGMAWVEAYSAYLRDNAILVKALSKIAWKITNSTPGGASSAAAIVRDAGEGIGGTASMATGNQLQGVGVPSASVNMGNGQPIIAAVASSYGVPVIALISSPGETGGSYGAASTLDEPTVKGMAAQQDDWTVFYREVLRDMGAVDGNIDFPAIQSDAAYRQIAAINQAFQLGLLWREEARNAVLDIADVTKIKDTLPEADGFNQWKDPNAAAEGVNDPLARQGNSGSVPGGLDQNSPDHDEDE